MVGQVNANGFQKTIEHLPVIDLYDIVAALDAKGFERVGSEHADLGIGGDVVSTDGVGIELGELAETAGTWLLVAVHGAGRIAAERLGQRLKFSAT